MKQKFLLTTLLAASVAGLFAFTNTQSAITGKVTPPDQAISVWAVSGSDTARGAITGGAFSLQVKPGTYKIVVDAKDPYKDATLDNVEVKDQPVDLGEITLQK